MVWENCQNLYGIQLKTVVRQISLSNGLQKNDKDFHKSFIENEKIVLGAMGFIPL